MTQSQFDELTRRIFIALPMAWKQLNENSPDIHETLLAWYRVLKDVTLEQANGVVDSWLDGKREPPKMYECDQVPFKIRAAVRGPMKASDCPEYAGLPRL